MDEYPWNIILTVVGVLVPIGAFLYEFVFVGRKRLGYRVQMDTTAADDVAARTSADGWQLLRRANGERPEPLVNPSFVLLRIENDGTSHINSSDYAVLPGNKVGVRVRFPGRRVAGLVVTEVSDEFLHESFDAESGLAVSEGEDEICLPKVPLNPGLHYKVLVVLESTDRTVDGRAKPFAEPVFIGGIIGGVGSGGMSETESRTRTSGPVMALIAFLVVIIVAQFGVGYVFGEQADPMDCYQGRLTLVGSTAFRPVLAEAADAYMRTCPGAEILTDTEGSDHGVRELNDSQSTEMVAFSDGAKPDGLPMLVERPVAFMLFTPVVNAEAGVRELSLEQLRDVFTGEYGNWEELGGADVPVRLVGRYADSGTRGVFEQRVLRLREGGTNSEDCTTLAPNAEPGVVRCERSSTDDLLDAVAQTPGAIGYSELGAVNARADVLPVQIDGVTASVAEADAGAYPYWETEYAYTYGTPDAQSLTAAFLRYLTAEVGVDVMRSLGHHPCGALSSPVLCRPETDPADDA
ncbi:substrate-binding domain-containing protein [Allonocardiopsis opalescens]|uniref:substrate-binding domain-containing protein n=1 Tax=Allonocardiopsis opalescens TaxID=1144618 RepID=UPI000D07BFCB|nr:substrate-binding domain-containing protein [Allonocardiopsis opalescens]